jgi:hypothetical protein
VVKRYFTLPPAGLRWIEDFVDNYEFGLAFEVLVDSLRENQIAVDSSDYERIESLGSAVKIEPPRWEDLARGSNSQ